MFVVASEGKAIENLWRRCRGLYCIVAALRSNTTSWPLRPVQHELGVGEVGQPRPMWALEIFAAVPFGVKAG